MEEALPALQYAHCAQRDQVVMANAIAKTKEFTIETVEEMKKVTWPDFAQLKNSTFVIIVFVIIVSLIIFAMDVVTRGVIDFVIKLFSR